MISKIIGIIWILLGILWLAKPDLLRNRLKKKMSRKMRRIVSGVVIVLGLFLIGGIITSPGLLVKIIGIIGVIVIIKAVLVLTSKTSEKALEWLADRPLFIFRIWAGIVLLAGAALVFL
jgi:threonine/homoserine/homoserine lactone efflux protein